MECIRGVKRVLYIEDDGCERSIASQNSKDVGFFFRLLFAQLIESTSLVVRSSDNIT